jgi:PAS domain S-box-containing protein
MRPAATQPEEILHLAVQAARTPRPGSLAVLDDLPAPLYVTDADGRITYFNEACVRFAGRRPELGKDSWCVSWKLFTEDGKPLRHDACPMAVAIREQRPIRDVEAIAERPDGSRVNFVPYPTPIHNETGALIGAVNLLLDVTNAKQADFLEDQARRCRRLALSVNDAQTVNTLLNMASDYQGKARELRPN